MAENDGAALAAWLQNLQGIGLNDARVREPAGVARRLSALTDAADTVLPFGAEPSGYALAQAKLIKAGDRR